MMRARKFYKRGVRAILDEIQYHRTHNDARTIKSLQVILCDLRRHWQQVIAVEKKENLKRGKNGRRNHQ